SGRNGSVLLHSFLTEHEEVLTIPTILNIHELYYINERKSLEELFQSLINGTRFKLIYYGVKTEDLGDFSQIFFNKEVFKLSFLTYLQHKRPSSASQLFYAIHNA